MYEYRRMTDRQRREVVEVRRQRGYPLHKPPHPDYGEGWYFITAATFEHRYHFTTSPELGALEQRLLQGFEESGLPCGGWVVLPNHYHALVWTADLMNLGRLLGRLHGRSARYVNRRDGKTGRQVWYKYGDRKVRSERHYWTCLHYILGNPVKHEHDRDWIIDLQREYPLLDMGKGWDQMESGSS